MIDRDHKLSVKRQASLLGISRGSVYYLPREVPETDLALMRRVDELHLDYPFAGSRMLRDLLAGEGLRVGRLHVSTLMKRMGIEALYRKPNTSKPEPGHKIYPYLLRKLAVTRPNQVWAIDITYVRMAKGVRHRSRTDGDQCLTLPRRRRRLVQSPGACLAAVDNDGGGLLYRGRRRSYCQVWLP
jgi:putative transposase